MKILIVDEIHPILIQLLQSKGFDCDYQPLVSISSALIQLSNYEGIVIRSKFRITKEIIEKNTHLKFIARLGSGLENVDVEFAKRNKILCINSPEGNKNAVAEHTVGMLLNLFNKICLSNQEVKNSVWQREKNRGIELMGKVIGIIGYGNTGSALAEKLKSFDVKILAFDKYKKGFNNEFVNEVSLNDIFINTDIVSLHVPLTNETTYMVDDRFINNFKKKFYLINTSRGRVVKTSDLVENLRNGKILGAMLDVIEYENTDLESVDVLNNDDFNYLKAQDNVLLTPHIAGWTNESFYKLSEVLAKKIIKHFEK